MQQSDVFGVEVIKDLCRRFSFHDEARLGRHLYAAAALYGLNPPVISNDDIKKLDKIRKKLREAIDIWQGLSDQVKEHMYTESFRVGTGEYLETSKPIVDDTSYENPGEDGFGADYFRELTNDLLLLQRLTETDVNSIKAIRAGRGKPANEPLKGLIRRLWVVWSTEFHDRPGAPEAQLMNFEYFVVKVAERIASEEVDAVSGVVRHMRENGELQQSHLR